MPFLLFGFLVLFQLGALTFRFLLVLCFVVLFLLVLLCALAICIATFLLLGLFLVFDLLLTFLRLTLLNLLLLSHRFCTALLFLCLLLLSCTLLILGLTLLLLYLTLAFLYLLCLSLTLLCLTLLLFRGRAALLFLLLLPLTFGFERDLLLLLCLFQLAFLFQLLAGRCCKADRTGKQKPSHDCCHKTIVSDRLHCPPLLSVGTRLLLPTCARCILTRLANPVICVLRGNERCACLVFLSPLFL